MYCICQTKSESKSIVFCIGLNEEGRNSVDTFKEIDVFCKFISFHSKHRNKICITNKFVFYNSELDLILAFSLFFVS